MAKLSESDKRFMGCLRNIAIGVAVMFLLPYLGAAVYGWIDSRNDKKNQERLQLVEECIENLDFVQARKLLAEYDSDTEDYTDIGRQYIHTKEKLSQAHIFHLIDQGQFSLAKQIAEEDGNPSHYKVVLMNQCIDLYDKYPKKELIKALSLVEISATYTEHWDVNKQEYIRSVNEVRYNVQVQGFNEDLDHFCKCLYAMGKKEDAKAFLNLLKPDYNGSTAKINKIKSQYR